MAAPIATELVPWAQISLRTACESARLDTMLSGLGATTVWCFGCQRERPASRGPLCRECWRQLSEAARTALSRPDEQALRRYRQLLAALRAKTPLAQISIA